MSYNQIEVHKRDVCNICVMHKVSEVILKTEEAKGIKKMTELTLTAFMSRTGGSTKREPRLFTMKEVTQKETRS